jgi:hypothetical protein
MDKTIKVNASNTVAIDRVFADESLPALHLGSLSYACFNNTNSHSSLVRKKKTILNYAYKYNSDLISSRTEYLELVERAHISNSVISSYSSGRKGETTDTHLTMLTLPKQDMQCDCFHFG